MYLCICIFVFLYQHTLKQSLQSNKHVKIIHFIQMTSYTTVSLYCICIFICICIFVYLCICVKHMQGEFAIHLNCANILVPVIEGGGGRGSGDPNTLN